MNYRRRAKRHHVEYEPVSMDLVRVRDRGRCGLCGGAVLRRRFPHPRSATLDHVVPMSEGGPHLYVNVQLAHLSCNVAKGTRSVGQLALL